jgi:putative spermidine/putrescine transport system permease protein
VLLRTFIYAVLSTLFCLLFGYPIAYTLAVHFPGNLRSMALLGISIPLWTSFVVRTFAWVWLLQTNGLINRLLTGLGVIEEPMQLLYNEGAVMLGLVYYELPFMILPIYAAIERVPESLLQASADLGARPWQTFRTVILPLTFPGVVAGSIFTFSLTLGDYIIPQLVGPPGYFIGTMVNTQQGSVGNLPMAAAFTVVPIVIIGGYLALARRLGAFDAL